jgi:hypothetical protein
MMVWKTKASFAMSSNPIRDWQLGQEIEEEAGEKTSES